MNIIDHEERTRALDPQHSFIIQAPAGSGKTELLTQRFLVLLAIAKQAPEEIVAITFTRKAASEMRARIYDALQGAALSPAPPEPHALKTWQLARSVLDRDKRANWQLLRNPNRLRILTIDALCTRIAKSSPFLSHFGTVPTIVEDATPYYTKAAHLLLSSLEDRLPFFSALNTLLLHLDNNYAVTESLFIGMLSRRDQWLSYMMHHTNNQQSREALEKGLQNIILDTLKRVTHMLPAKLRAELLELARFAGHCLKKSNNNNLITNWCDINGFPEATIEHLPHWLGLAEMLLTKSFEWRKSVNKTCGFPAAADALDIQEANLFKQMKDKMLCLLQHLSQHDSLLSAFKQIHLLPPAHYSTSQWEIVSALTALLPVLVAYLHVVFKEHNITDFIAIAEGAIQALGESDNPSELALNLDYKIQHLLIDEFQDTSVTQYKLLELLTCGWEQQDGRTLFLVGDPMQSIYRFREAEVGIFLRAKRYGIGHIKLIPLTLQVNFRSCSSIVTWFNDIFKGIFPPCENIELGAIPFSTSVAFSPHLAHKQAVYIHSFVDANEDAKTQHISQLVAKLTIENPSKSIGILVRSRSHLQAIVPALKKEKLAFQAIEIDKLIYSPAVRDLLALTKALGHLGDRIAWLAILRAPWCGLKLHDLYLIANYDHNKTLWESLRSYLDIKELSEDAVSRLTKIMPVLERALNQRARSNYRTWIAYTWYALGGPACLEEEHEMLNTESYLALLEQFSDSAILDYELLERQLLNSYCHPTPGHSNIHLMTIHKAKGLEFDIVIIPELQRKPAIDDSRLLLWLERQNNQGQTDLILAPIKSIDEDFDAIYRYIRTQNYAKTQLETTRLLYVAITRAREILHLYGSVETEENNLTKVKPPSSGSFLELLWPALHQHFKFQPTAETATFDPSSNNRDALPRLVCGDALGWDYQHETEALTLSNSAFTWYPTYLNHVGTVIHHILQQLSFVPATDWLSLPCLASSLYWEKKLQQLGVDDAHMKIALELIQKSINSVLQDARSRWILSNEHQDARSEFQISCVVETSIVHYIIDRTFIDADGTRWIIDYKSSDLVSEDRVLFLAQSKLKYQEQLFNYGSAMQLLEDRPIKLALYFPLFSGWCEWDFERR